MPLSSLSKNYLKKLNKIVFPLCLISDLREEDTPEERKLYVKSQHGQLFYRTNLTNSKECEITSEDFLAIGIDENRTQSFFVGIKTNEDLLTFIEIYKYDLLKIIAKREHIPKIDSENLNDLEKIKKYFEGQQATFTDKLNAILRFIDSSDTEKNSWRKFFDGLRILRNKSSHSDPSLSEAEVQSLQDGGFAVMVSNANTLQLNTRQYAQVVKGVLDFWDKFDRQ
jgi:hypothetical protein